MDLVDEHDHVGICLQFLHQGLQAFLKLSAILRACHHTRHIEGIDALAEEHRRRMVVGDELCQSFDDGTFTHTWLTYQDWIILLPSSQDLDDALDLLLTAHTGVESSLSSGIGEVCAERVEHGRLRGRFLLGGGCRSSRSSGTAGVSGGIRGFLEFLLVFIGQADTVSNTIIFRRIEHSHSVFVIHIVQF